MAKRRLALLVVNLGLGRPQRGVKPIPQDAGRAFGLDGHLGRRWWLRQDGQAYGDGTGDRHNPARADGRAVASNGDAAAPGRLNERVGRSPAPDPGALRRQAEVVRHEQMAGLVDGRAPSVARFGALGARSLGAGLR